MEIKKWQVFELVLEAKELGANPYLENAMRVDFKGPNGIEKQVSGFWDGENRFVVRFTPTLEGEWTYQTCSENTSLHGVTGAFLCVSADEASRGFLRRDEDYRYHFRWDDGSRFFMCGTTYYEILKNAAGGDNWKKAVDGCVGYGINKARIHVNPLWVKPPDITPYPNTLAFDGTHDKINVVHWRLLDDVVRYMAEKDMVTDLIMFAGGGGEHQMDLFGTQEQDERYVRYILARYAAFPNVMWCLVNEWNYTPKEPDYWNGLGEIAAAEDPWAEDESLRRLLTIHQQTRIDFQYFGQDWLTHACFQYGVRNRTQAGDEWSDFGETQYRHGDAWGHAGVIFNMNHDIPVVNDEFGYIGEPVDKSEPDEGALTREKHRQILWGIHVAGGYSAAGDKTQYEDGRPYMCANWHDTAEYGDMKRLIDFFTNGRVPYWKMSIDQDVIFLGERVYVLSEPGQHYVVYAAVGGEMSLILPFGQYRAERYDPRTGEYENLGEMDNHVAITFPDAQDWVVVLERL